MNTTQHRNDAITEYKSKLAEIEADRWMPTLRKHNWTVTIDGSFQGMQRTKSGSLSFFASWNKGTQYFTKEDAERIAADLRKCNPETELKFEIVSRNTLRDRAEIVLQSSVAMLEEVAAH